MIDLNETILIIILTWAITKLFGILEFHAVHNAILQNNPDMYGKAMLHCNRLETIRNLVIGEQIRFNHVV